MRGGLSFKKTSTSLLLLCGAALAAAPGWLERVEPVITPAERKVYLSLPVNDRRKFEEDFWAGKGISAQQYFARVEYIDATFGSNRPGSGANTDQGRIYLSLGPPARITRLPSSRTFVPLEIWYYDAVPGVLSTELRLIFFRQNGVGYPQLYSPTTDTIRALLQPQAGTRSMFGPNDSVTESDIRKVLKVGPAEDEVITAAVGVATGIKTTGNDEILGRISSPREMLGRPQRTEVRSRLIVARPKLDILRTVSAFGGSQVDFRLETAVRSDLEMEVGEGAVTVYRNRLRLGFAGAEPVDYTHRLDLLPGSYRVLFTVDGKTFPYEVNVPAQAAMGEIVRSGWGREPAGRQTPFEFDGRQVEPAAGGRFAMVALAAPGRVTWMVRRGMEVLWRSTVEGKEIAMIELPVNQLAPGSYRLEAVTANESRGADLLLKPDSGAGPERKAISFNANLAPALRLAFVGHQWLLRGRLSEARRCLESSLSQGPTDQAAIELARVDAMSGQLDAARDRVRGVLARRPDSFDALSVYAYIETQFQDYPAAAELYRRALALEDSPALRAALAKLPAQ